jgi:acyl-coenzyme A synthetase/AMP-(fatty) acid ligase
LNGRGGRGSALTDVSASARLRALASLAPAELALSGRDGYVRYRELDDAADRVAAWLLTRLGRGRHRVGLCAASDHACLVAALGVARSGKICVPLDPSLPLGAIDALCADASASVVVSDLVGAMGPGALGVPLVSISECVQPAPGGPVTDPRPGLSSVIHYADPYAEPPAGVVMSDAGVLRWVTALERSGVAAAGVRCAVGWAGSSPEGTERLVALALAGACAVTGISDQELYSLLAGGNADTLFVDSPTLRRLAAMGPPDAGTPPVSVVGLWGGPVAGSDVATARGWLGPDVHAATFYAPPETGLVAMLTVPPGEEVPWSELLPAGWCPADVEVEIVDGGGCRIGPGQDGHIVVWGPELPGAYWANPALTEKRWLAGPGGRRWCRTGDAGRWDGRGRLVVQRAAAYEGSTGRQQVLVQVG